MKKTVGVIFSGYGEQFVTMGKDLYNDSRHVQDLFEQASMCLGINFVQLCFASSDAEISSIDKGYLAILLTQISIYSELSQAGLRPDFIAGFGIGEYASVVASGSLSFADALYLLNKYATMYRDFLVAHPHYSMLQLPRGFTRQTLQELCDQVSHDDKKVFIAAHTTENGFYVAGHIDCIEQIQEYCKSHEIRKVKEVSAAYGLHSLLVDEIVTTLSPYFFKIDFKALKFPMITNVDAVYVTSPDALESAVLRRINSPILWDEVMDGFVGCDVLICVGPGKQVVEWAQLKYPDKEIYSVQNLADVRALQALLQSAVDQEELIAAGNVEDGSIEFGVCHVDDDNLRTFVDLSQADEVNELPGDYDIDEYEDAP